MIKAAELLAASVPFTYSVMHYGPKPSTQCRTRGCREEKYVSPSGKMNSYCPKCRNKIEKERGAVRRAMKRRGERA
jgi:hypothetical protein